MKRETIAPASIQYFPLAQLYVSDLNPRQDADPEGIDLLADSLAMIGLIQNLSGILDGEGRVGIVAGGRRLRAIARAIVQGAQAILADEPVASLDPVSARKVMELLVELNKRDGMGVIVTLHQVDYAIRYCDRVIALQGGKIVYDGPSMGLDQQRLIEIYGPEFEDAFWETKA